MYTAVPAGELRHRVTIIRVDRSLADVERNEVGETIPQFVPSRTRWAKIETPTAEERYRAAEVYENVSHIVTIRYTPELSPADQLQYQGRTFNIASLIDPEERHIDLVLMCKEQIEPTN